ncbi:hypothetical protein [Acrocarpospora catenulata]|uniref:hypothetical protein n=1 Tax=Acrocarpospora catenulata TaxID=2836182 RepID=UPI001BDA9CE7|nr:hypothetical protein [Acrocarpospora catenulata]
MRALSPPNDWTPSERRLWSAFRQGTQLDLEGPNPVSGEPGDEYWGPERIIRAEAICHLLLHGPEQLPGKPARLILKGTRISGWLDAGCAELDSFLFIECVFDRTPFLNDARAQFIGFTNCRLPGLDAERIRSGPVWLSDNRLLGPIHMEDAEIGGDLRINGSTIDAGQGNSAVTLNGAHLAGDLDIRGARITGQLSMATVRIDGDLLLTNAGIAKPGDWALYAPKLTVGASIIGNSGVQVTGGLFLEGATAGGAVLLDRIEVSRPLETALHLDHCRFALDFKCDDARIHGTVQLHQLVSGCQVSLQRTRVSDVKKNENAVNADHLEVGGSAYFADVDLAGPLSLHGARIDCSLSIAGAKLSAPATAAAFNADGARVGNHFIAKNCTSDGAVILTAIQIDGNANFIDATITNGSATALDLRRSVIKGSLAVTGSFAATGSVKLVDATLGVDIRLTDATLNNPRGRALAASGMRVAGDFIADRCTVQGLVDLPSSVVDGDLRFVDATLAGVSADESSRGFAVDVKGEWRGLALRCTGSRIAGDLDLRGARLERELVMDSASVSRTVRLEGTHLATEGRSVLRADGLTAETLVLRPAALPVRAVSLASANVQELADGATSWPVAAPINISGFHYERLDSDLPVAERLVWLERATPTYAAGPYEKLAACLELAGQNADARVVRLASIRRSHQSKNLMIRLWGGLQDAVIGYGYAPGRALAIFALLLVGAGIWFSLGIADCLPASPGLCPVKADEHPTWDPWLYSLDLLIPLIDLGHEKAWDPLGASKVVTMVLVMSGWVLTTTMIAAAGRTLRRT